MSTCEVCGYIKSRCVCGTNPPEEEDYGDEALRLARKVGLLNGANAFTGVIDMDYKLVRLIAAARAESAHWPAPSASIDAAQPASDEKEIHACQQDAYAFKERAELAEAERDSLRALLQEGLEHAGETWCEKARAALKGTPAKPEDFGRHQGGASDDAFFSDWKLPGEPNES
jgi:hypothetical protein